MPIDRPRGVGQPPNLRVRKGSLHRQDNYGSTVFFGVPEFVPNPGAFTIEPFDKGVRVVDVSATEPGSWVVDLDTRCLIAPNQEESAAKTNRVTATIGMGTGSLSSRFEVDVYGCARLCLPCETLTVEVTAHDVGVIGEGTDSPVCSLQKVEATCQRTWANTIARTSVQLIGTALDPGDPVEGIIRVPKYACRAHLYGPDGSMVYDNNAEYEFFSQLYDGTGSDPQELLELSGTDWRTLLLRGTGVLLPPFCDGIAWSLGGGAQAVSGDWMTFSLAL